MFDDGEPGPNRTHPVSAARIATAARVKIVDNRGRRRPGDSTASLSASGDSGSASAIGS
jgi:hypothetical protein